MYFLIKDEEFFDKFNDIREKISNIIKKKKKLTKNLHITKNF